MPTNAFSLAATSGLDSRFDQANTRRKLTISAVIANHRATVKESEQNTPSFSSDIMTGLAKHASAREQMLFVVAGAGGLRIGEALGVEIDKHLSADSSTVNVKQKARRGRVESRLKTSPALLSPGQEQTPLTSRTGPRAQQISSWSTVFLLHLSKMAACVLRSRTDLLETRYWIDITKWSLPTSTHDI